MELLHITCRFTGIEGHIDLPFVPSKTLEYTHPLASYKTVDDLLSADILYIDRCDRPVIVGCILTILSHYNLLQKDGMPAALAVNRALSLASRKTLHRLLVGLHTVYSVRKPLAVYEDIPTRSFATLPVSPEEASALADSMFYTLVESQSTFSKVDTADELSLRVELATEAGIARREQKRRTVKPSTKLSDTAALPANKARHIKEKYDLDSLDGYCPLGSAMAALDTLTVGKIIPYFYKLLMADFKAEAELTDGQLRTYTKIECILQTMEDAQHIKIVTALQGKDLKSATRLARFITIIYDNNQSKGVSSINEGLTCSPVRSRITTK